MDKKQKNEMLEVFAEGFHEVVVPELEKITDRLTEVERGVDTLNRKFDAQQDRLDRHGKDIDTLKQKFATT